MGKVEIIKKSRKEQTCNKCRKVIPVGSTYYKGVLFRRNPIIRCSECGLKSYEVTTSDYVRQVGTLIDRWQEMFEFGENMIQDIVDELESILDECQCNLDNIPEQLHDGNAGQILQERIDELEGIISDLSGSDYWYDFIAQGYENLSGEYQEIIDEEMKTRNITEYITIYEEFITNEHEIAIDWQNEVRDVVSSIIEDALYNLSY